MEAFGNEKLFGLDFTDTGLTFFGGLVLAMLWLQ